MTQEEIQSWFAYNPPTEKQIESMQVWRKRVSDIAYNFVFNSPAGPDQTAALRKLKEALMAMNAALVSPSPSPHMAKARDK